jgi:4'-phosphopantetheinyl transferase EntD
MISIHGIRTDHCDSRSGGWPVDLRSWLSDAELDEQVSWRHPVRRTEWLAGRWLIKSMLRRDAAEVCAGLRSLEICEIEVLSRDVTGRSRAPRALCAGRALTGHVSLAHADGVVWAAVSPSADMRVGIDVVRDTDANKHLPDLWFTPREREWAERVPPAWRAAALWSAKEAAYKATNRGEPFIPAQYEILPDDAGRLSWTQAGVPRRDGEHLMVRRIGNLTVTLATSALGFLTPRLPA